MKPSLAFQQKRHDIRQVASRFPVSNPRIFGSVLHGNDADDSDLDLLVDTLCDTTLFDLSGLQLELEDFLGVSVDVVTPGDLSPRLRSLVLAEAQPV